MSATAAINVNVPAELNEKLEAQAKARLTSKSAVIREVLLQHVNQAPERVQFSRRSRKKSEVK
jgi:hypothetical protein